MKKTFMPKNLAINLFDFCDGCENFRTREDVFYEGKAERVSITCESLDTCLRWNEKLKEATNCAETVDVDALFAKHPPKGGSSHD